ncbi:unnamed protein product [Toxocara canis]|uniref:FABP domain-containing protein n=1 Tax=Toxocara canis TaxID=6265 RepID=A0A183V1C0_TOXCA|nr:unnamed protein product [Toxocara canis]
MIFINVFVALLASFRLVSCSAMASANVRIPEKFMGTFKLDRSVNWFVRKMIGFSSVTKVFGVSKNDPDAYDMSNLSSKKNTHFNNWKLNQTFESEGLDSKMHKVLNVGFI